ncbi:DnaJ-domain-containing protein [Cystobasidium minutum MCA 4210]|uniref:DnaJ-domain-containing protein n=1 Tax=Cystobasidium minutum MCA 4210 TaxID=1397322 RepID=UPI0034CFEF93|eukprot:jgi/Rhomi1/145978/e_gw1.5.848.1
MADKAAAGGEKPQGPADINRDGIKVLDMSYYELLGVRADAGDAQIKSAYKKAALKFHPDRNIGDPNAEKRFQEIGEAYQVLSNNDLRAVYDRHGKKSNQAQPEEGFTDPGQLFAQLFGGERFVDWIGELSLGKDFSKAMDISLTEEEKEEMRKEAEGKKDGTASPDAAAGIAGEKATPASPTSPATGAATAGTDATSAAAPGTSTDLHVHSSGTSTPASASGHSNSKMLEKEKARQQQKLTAEQRKKMDELAEERRKNEIERIQQLTNKLKDRVRPFVTATNPGDASADEYKRWEKNIRDEVEDLKGQSFGYELCQLIGQIYFQKAHAFLKAHKSPLSNFLGLSTWWGRMKDRGATLKEGWSFLSTTLDVQSAMSQLEKNGEVDEEKLGEELMGKMMLVSWKGTRFEVASVLRQVVDGVLSKSQDHNKGVSDLELVNRAKAILVIGSIMKNIQVDETDEERREMERLVAKANADRKNKKKGKKHAEKA